MGLARKVGAKLYNFSVHKYNEYKDERAFRKEERATFKQAERQGRLKRAAKEGYKSGRTKPRSKIARATSIIRTDGPDPFGIFQNSSPRSQPKQHRRSGTTIIIQGNRVRTKRKKRSSTSYWDNLL